MKNLMVVLLVLLAHINFGLAAGPVIPTQIQGVDLSGQKRTLSIRASAPLSVVVFLSAECPCSKSHVEHLRDLKAKYPSIQFIGVLSNAEEDATEAGKILNGIGFPVLLDPEQTLANSFGAVKTPHVFVIQSGNLVFHGGVSDSSHFPNAKVRHLEIALSQIQASKSPSPVYARALGCDIRRR